MKKSSNGSQKQACMDELSISWNRLIHPDTDTIKRRDEMLLNAPDYIQTQDGSIVAEIKMSGTVLTEGGKNEDYRHKYDCQGL